MWSTAVSMDGNVLSTWSGRRPARKRRVALRVERLGVRHPAAHPEHDDRIGGRDRASRRSCAATARGNAGGQRRKRRGAGGRQEVASGARRHVSAPLGIPGSITMLQSRSSRAVWRRAELPARRRPTRVRPPSACGRARGRTRRRRSRRAAVRPADQRLGSSTQVARQRRAVQQFERLQRRRRGRSRRHDLFAVGAPQRQHQRVGRDQRRACPLGLRHGMRSDERDVETRVRTFWPDAGDGADGVDELLGGEASGLGPAKHVRLVGGRRADRHALIRVGRQDDPHRALQVVAVCHQILGQPVEQVRMPRGLFHVVDRLDQPAAHESRPQPVDDRAGQPAVARADQRVHQLIQSHAARRRRDRCCPARHRGTSSAAVLPVGRSHSTISSGCSA